MAPSTERHQLVEIEVGTPLGPLHQMMHVKLAPCAAGLTAPARAGKDSPPDARPLLNRGGGAPRGAGASSTAPLSRAARPIQAERLMRRLQARAQQAVAFAHVGKPPADRVSSPRRLDASPFPLFCPRGQSVSPHLLLPSHRRRRNAEPAWPRRGPPSPPSTLDNQPRRCQPDGPFRPPAHRS